MKKIICLLVAGVMALMLAGCGGDAAVEELDKNDTEKAEAKTASVSSKEEKPEKEANEEDIWTYYNDAKWSDDYNGLKMEIQKAVVTDKAPTMEDENAETSAVGVKFKMENTTDGKFTFYPDQAVLVTSTGEQIDMPDMWVSDSIGGEIDKGVIKEGNIIWYLERGHAEEIEWIKMEFGGHQGGDDDFNSERKEYEIELQLK
ncbi:LptM family lipoprotein [Rossellomorea arthrocnemi]